MISRPRLLLVLSAAVACTSACASKTSAPAPPAVSAPTPAARLPGASCLARGIDPRDMEPLGPRLRDFYQYANGGWMKTNPIPPDRPSGAPSTSSRSATATASPDPRERGEEHVRGERLGRAEDRRLLRELHGRGGDRGAGREPLKPRVRRGSTAISTSPTSRRDRARSRRSASTPSSSSASEQDRKKRTDVIATAVQGGLGLPDRDYYTEADDASKKLREPVRRARDEDVRAPRRDADRRRRRTPRR